MPLKVSFCIVCMDRLSHLKHTLPRSIRENQDFHPYVEFVLLDYNSKDGLEEWVKESLGEHLDSGILTYLRTSEPIHFHRSHSRNVALKNATGDILCNLDADNFAGPGFARYLSDRFAAEDNIFLVPNRFEATSKDGYFGKLCVRKEDFMQVRGYDETLSGWGYEDVDIFYRLKQLGLSERHISDTAYLDFIDHDHHERVKNQKNFHQLFTMYTLMDDQSAETIFLYKDKTLERGTIRYKDEDTVQFLGGAASTLKEKQWTKGCWKMNKDHFQFDYFNVNPKTEMFQFDPGLNAISSTRTDKKFARVTSPSVVNLSLMLNEATKNYQKFIENYRKKITVANHETFGLAELQTNFASVF